MKKVRLERVQVPMSILDFVRRRVAPLLNRSMAICTSEQLAVDCYTQGVSDMLTLHERGRLDHFPRHTASPVDYQI